MSIDRGDRVMSQMLRSLCCATRVAKVATDSDVVVDNDAHKSPQTSSVILSASDSVLHRGLLGKLITGLEDRRMVSAELRILTPTQEMIDSSKLSLNCKSPSIRMISEWHGDTIDTLQQYLNSFQLQYSLQSQDIVYIEKTPAEYKIWFEPVSISEPEPTTLPISTPQIVEPEKSQEPQPEESEPKMDEIGLEK